MKAQPEKIRFSLQQKDPKVPENNDEVEDGKGFNRDPSNRGKRWKNLAKAYQPAESSAIPSHHETRDIGTLPQLALLLCKCMKMIWQYKLLLTFEALAPVLGAILLATYVSTLDLENDPNPITYSPFGYDPIELHHCKLIYVEKNSEYVDKIIADLREDRSDILHVRYTYSTTLDFDSRLTDGSLCAVINFLNLPLRLTDDLPEKIKYELRLPAVPKLMPLDQRTMKPQPIPILSNWETDLVYPTGFKVGPRNRYDRTGGTPGYYNEGFLYLQHKIDCVLLRLIHEKRSLAGELPMRFCRNLHISPHFKRFPYPPYKHVNLVPVISKLIPFVIVTSYIALFCTNTWLLVQEKEIGMKGFLEYFNVSPWRQWVSWLVSRMMLHCIALVLVVFILLADLSNNRAVINQSSPFIIYFFLLTYVLNSMCISSLFSTLFAKARTAAILAAAIWILTYLPSGRVNYDVSPNKNNRKEEQFSVVSAVIFCLFGNFGLSYGFHVITNAEVNSNGVNGGNLWREPFGVGHVILCMNAMSFFSILLAIYIEHVSPTSNAREQPHPLFYFLSVRWWKGEQLTPSETKKASINVVNEETVETKNPQYFEKLFRNADDVEISLQNATLRLKGDAVGINEISHNFMTGEIVSILGANKSGKTALYYVCAGLRPVDKGNVKHKKRNIKSDMTYVRANVGLCPQVNALYDYLSVEEHVSFFVQLKGVIIAADAYEEIEDLIDGLDLETIRKTRAKNLSEGEKRLVHIAIAFAGGSKVVLLDEPTEGMSVPMQRTAWRFMDSEREIRCIVLFTRSPEEASYVGDRVVILEHGRIHAKGTPSFIKSVFDGGYHLNIQKGPGFNLQGILEMAESSIPRVHVIENTAEFLTILLPDECTPFFPNYFNALKGKKESFGIPSYNLAYASFDDIFKSITKVAVKKQRANNPGAKKRVGTHWSRLSVITRVIGPLLTSKVENLPKKKKKGFSNALKQLKLLFIQNVLFSRRRWKWNIFAVSFVVMTIFLGPFLMTKLGYSRMGPIGGVQIDLKNFVNPKALFQCNDNYRIYEDFCDSVRKAVKDTGLTIVNATGVAMDSQLLQHYEEASMTREIPFLIAVDVRFQHFENNVIIYFDNQALHVLPVASTIFTRIFNLRILKAINHPASENEGKHEIQVINRPLPYSIPERLRISRSFLGLEIVLGNAVCWGAMFYLPSNLAFQIQAEKRFKTLLKIEGINIYVFWFSKLLWNASVILILAIFCGPIYFLFGYSGFDNLDIVFALNALFFCWGLCSICIVYAVCLIPAVIKNVRLTFFYIWMVGIWIGPVPWTVIQYVTYELYDEELLKPWLYNLNKFFLLFPGYTLAISTHRIAVISQYNTQCAQIKFLSEVCRTSSDNPCCDEKARNYQGFGRFSVTKIEIGLLIEAAVLLAVIFILETQWYQSCRIKLAKTMVRWRLRRNKVQPSRSSKHDDEYFQSLEGKDAKSLDFEILLNNISKQTSEELLLDKLSLGIKRLECFGFVGTEGSGQSTVLRLMSGCSYPTTGDITIEDLSLLKNYRKYVSEVSFCPKEHMLFLEFTGLETLMLIGTVKGIPKSPLKKQIDELAYQLRLEKILNQLVMHYDIGARRKLSFALALLGNPRILILEQPFHEIDPESREQMKCILLEKKAHTTIVLSSSKIEMIVALCDRLALLIDGKLVCMGSPSFIMSSYGKGITITIQLVPEAASFYSMKTFAEKQNFGFSVEEFLLERINEVPEPIERHQNPLSRQVQKGVVYKYEVPKGSDESNASDTGDRHVNSLEKKAKLGDSGGLDAGKEQANQNLGSKIRTGSLESSYSSQSSSSVSSMGSGSLRSGASDVSDELWEQELDPIMEYMEDNFPTAKLFDKVPCYLQYHLEDEDMDLGDIFRKMEIARIAFELEAYRVGTGTISQLLGSYTRTQANKKEKEA